MPVGVGGGADAGSKIARTKFAAAAPPEQKKQRSLDLVNTPVAPADTQEQKLCGMSEERLWPTMAGGASSYARDQVNRPRPHEPFPSDEWHLLTLDVTGSP